MFRKWTTAIIKQASANCKEGHFPSCHRHCKLCNTRLFAIWSKYIDRLLVWWTRVFLYANFKCNSGFCKKCARVFFFFFSLDVLKSFSLEPVRWVYFFYCCSAKKLIVTWVWKRILCKLTNQQHFQILGCNCCKERTILLVLCLLKLHVKKAVKSITKLHHERRSVTIVSFKLDQWKSSWTGGFGKVRMNRKTLVNFFLQLSFLFTFLQNSHFAFVLIDCYMNAQSSVEY